MDNFIQDIDAPNNEDDDFDYVPLSNLRNKKPSYVEKSIVSKKKRGRPRKRKLSDTFENEKVFSDLEKLMDGENLIFIILQNSYRIYYVWFFLCALSVDLTIMKRTCKPHSTLRKLFPAFFVLFLFLVIFSLNFFFLS